MAETMIASEITDGQIENAVEKLRAAIRKHRYEIPSEVAQRVLGVKNLGMEMFDIIRDHAEQMSDMIIRRASVNRTRTPQEALNATGREQDTDSDVVAAMSKGESDEVEVFFFQLHDRYLNHTDLLKEYELRGLKPADAYSLAAVNETDPTFADCWHPNTTYWQDINGKWCYLDFSRWGGSDHCCAGRSNGNGWWSDLCWFAGLRK